MAVRWWWAEQAQAGNSNAVINTASMFKIVARTK